MNTENLEQRAMRLLDGAEEAGKDLYTFIKEQAPDLCDEIIRWGICKAGIVLIVSFVIGIISIYYIRKGAKIQKNLTHEQSGGDEDLMSMVMLVIGIGAGFSCLGIFLSNINDFVKPMIAPKLYLVDYFRSIM